MKESKANNIAPTLFGEKVVVCNYPVQIIEISQFNTDKQDSLNMALY